MPSAKEVFAEIQERLTANPEKTKGMNAVYQFDLSGDEGGQWHIAIKDGTASVKEGQAESPNVTISMSASDFVDMATGKLDGTMAFMSGKLKLKGDMGLAMKLQSLLR